MSKFSVALKLFIITAVAAVCLALANKITAPITANNEAKAFAESLSAALPDAKEFKAMDPGIYEDETVVINSINAGYADKEHKDLKGYVVMATSSEGYGGEVGVMIGVGKDFKITNVIIASPFSETPGLGAKAKKPQFLDQFVGKSGVLKVVKGDASNDSEISAISSATITSKAVTKCVNAAIDVIKQGADKNTAVAEEIQKTAVEKDEQSQAELDAVEENRKDEPTPVIIEENEEGKGNE